MAQLQATGGSLLMDCLIGLGAHKGFGVPGESYLAVLDAMYDRADQFQLILCRHEGGAAYMAEAWGKLTGTPGICFVTRGPGATTHRLVFIRPCKIRRHCFCLLGRSAPI